MALVDFGGKCVARQKKSETLAMRHRFVVLICVAMAVTLAIRSRSDHSKSTVCDPDPPLSGYPGLPNSATTSIIPYLFLCTTR